MNKVYFIGAGPGDPELITLKGARLLGACETVIYTGSLVPQELLVHCNVDAEVYNSASLNLHEIIDIISSAYKKGHNIARLHTGDPSVYGAINEQMQLLDDKGIPYELIPGVTALFAAAAALKCELTVPEVSQSIIITRYSGRTAVPEDFATLAKAGGTLALYLSSTMIDSAMQHLLAEGMAADTPVNIVYRASQADERIIKGTLATIDAQNIAGQAVIIIGKALSKDGGCSKLYDANFSHGTRPARV